MINRLTALLAIAGASFITLAALPSKASAHEWRADSRIVQRCDRDGDECAPFRCDWDGDDCVQVGPWRHRYTTYYRQPYSYQFQFGLGYQNYNQDRWRDQERREERREHRHDRDDDD